MLVSSCPRKTFQGFNEVSQIPFKDFCGICEKPEIVYITLEEFMHLSKEQQTSLKNVGGWFFGKCHGGKRSTETIETRSALAIDLDDMPVQDFEKFLKVLNSLPYHYVAYTTFKHSEEAPRFRVIVPFKNDLSNVSLYEPVSRKFCKQYLDIEWTDWSTHQKERFMFKPAVSKNGQYLCYSTKNNDDKQFLDFKEILLLYGDKDPLDEKNWDYNSVEKKRKRKGSSESSGKLNSAKKGIFGGKKKRQLRDPRYQPGEPGTFCHLYYPIQKAITEFLSDVYVPTSDPNRFSYAEADSHGGLVILQDGQYAYSHHSKDPAADGHMHDAFDLVCLHLYDNNAEKMIKDLQQDREFFWASIGLDPSIETLDRRFVDLRTGRVDNYQPVYEWYLTHHPSMKDIKLMYNEFSDYVNISGKIGWRNTQKINQEKRIAKKAGEKDLELWIPEPNDPRLGDWDESEIHNELQKTLKIRNKDILRDAILNVSKRNGFNPVQEMILSVEWDGIDRNSTALQRYMGAEDHPAVSLAFKYFMRGAVLRAFHAGAQHDTVLILSGPEGIGKSTFFRQLGLGEYTLESFTDFSNKDSYLKCRGKMIVCLNELNAMKKADRTELLDKVAITEDEYRDPYLRASNRYPRKFVWAGTTNDLTFLIEEEGNRRFHPVLCFKENVKEDVHNLGKDEVLQMMAQARYELVNGELSYAPNDSDEYQVLKQYRDKFIHVPDWKDTIDDLLKMYVSDGYYDLVDWDDRWKNQSRSYKNGMVYRPQISRQEIRQWFKRMGIQDGRISQQMITKHLANRGYVSQGVKGNKDKLTGRVEYFVPDPEKIPTVEESKAQNYVGNPARKSEIKKTENEVFDDPDLPF